MYRYNKPLLTGLIWELARVLTRVACAVACCIIMSSLLCSSPGNSGSRRSLCIAPELGLPLDWALPSHGTVLSRIVMWQRIPTWGRLKKKRNMCLANSCGAAFRAPVPGFTPCCDAYHNANPTVKFSLSGNYGPNKILIFTIVREIFWTSIRVGVRDPVRGQDFYRFHVVRACSGAYPASCRMDTGAFPPGAKRQGREADHWPPTSAEVKNTLIYTSTPPCVFMAQCLIGI
jgi:hypothetical protein